MCHLCGGDPTARSRLVRECYCVLTAHGRPVLVHSLEDNCCRRRANGVYDGVDFWWSSLAQCSRARLGSEKVQIGSLKSDGRPASGPTWIGEVSCRGWPGRAQLRPMLVSPMLQCRCSRQLATAWPLLRHSQQERPKSVLRHTSGMPQGWSFPQDSHRFKVFCRLALAMALALNQS